MDANDPVGASEPQVMLAKAALSHLELALRSLASHANYIEEQDLHLVSSYSSYLASLDRLCWEGVQDAAPKVAHDHFRESQQKQEPHASVKLIALDMDDDTAHGTRQPQYESRGSEAHGTRQPQYESRGSEANRTATHELSYQSKGSEALEAEAEDTIADIRRAQKQSRGKGDSSRSLGAPSVVRGPNKRSAGYASEEAPSVVRGTNKRTIGYASEASVTSKQHVVFKSEASVMGEKPIFTRAGSRLESEWSSQASGGCRNHASMLAADGGETRMEDWQLRVLDMFEQLDQDGNGSIDAQEIRQAFDILGLPQSHRKVLLREIDESNDGKIDYLEWLHMMQHMDKAGHGAVKHFVQALSDRQAKNGRIYPVGKKNTHPGIISPHGRFRVTWDLILVFALALVALGMPFSLAFGTKFFPQFRYVNDMLDGLFMLDVLLNFFTAYYDDNGNKVYHPRRIACRYLRTWFVLDFVSSLPLEHLTTGLLPNMQPAKLLKLGKATKALKMLRLGKAMRLSHASELSEWLEDQCSSVRNQALLKLVITLTLSVVVCHWLACFMVISGDQWLLQYEAVEHDAVWKPYVAALYWAMTTVTTVGYGDITPKTDWERAYASISMVIGGCFYAYVVGSVSAILTAGDLNSSSYNERMGLVQAWLNFHDELPPELRRRIRRHFKELLTRKSALDDNAVLNDLSPDLRYDVAIFLVHEDVRFNPLFQGLPPHAFSRLMLITQRIAYDAGEKVTEMGNTAEGMYILVDGSAKFEEGHQWRNKGKSEVHVLGPGDSFGEEVVLGLERTYTYSVITMHKTVFHYIPEDRFAEMFSTYTDLMLTMRANFVGDTNNSSASQSLAGSGFTRGRATVSNAGSSGIPPGFSDVVIESFDELAKTLEELRTRVEDSSMETERTGMTRTPSAENYIRFASARKNTITDLRQAEDDGSSETGSRGQTRSSDDMGRLERPRAKGRHDTLRMGESTCTQGEGNSGGWNKNLSRDFSTGIP